MTLERPGISKPSKPRRGIPRHLRLNYEDFSTVLSVRAKHKAHNNILEAEAFLLWLRWLLRTSSRHGVRAICMVDSKVVLGGVTKGRSTSRSLLRVLRKVAALSLGGDLLLRLLYIPTECNPSDPPSRGSRKRPQSRASRNDNRIVKQTAQKSRFHSRLNKEIERSPCRDELRLLTDDDTDFWTFKTLRK